MVDPRDLGLVTQVRSPHHEAPTIYLYEAVPGGVGLSPSGCSTATTSSSPGAAELIARLRLRQRLPGLHRAAPRAGRRREGARAAAPRHDSTQGPDVPADDSAAMAAVG